ncbi:hypothetical protein DL98DRAFT_519807 [Cadophora sp. DSE1049]|nr:hypothetical protein DL98DRAFT_519807 [Cadophora sp. DSE1049]
MMGFNRVDLGKDGLAGSIYATPGMTFGTKREDLEEQDQKEHQERVKDAAKAAEEAMNGTSEGSGDAAEKTSDGMKVESGATNGTS